MVAGRTIYEWEQTLDEVLVFVRPPGGVRARDLDVDIKARHLRLGLRGNPPFLDHDLFGTVLEEVSVWMLDEGEVQITLAKAVRAETWKAVFVGHGELDTAATTEVQKKLMLERFQMEHPGFDFSNADFSGSVPDPKEFLGGVRHKS